MKTITTPLSTKKATLILVALMICSVSIFANTKEVTPTIATGVVYESISAKVSGNSVLVNWKTASEQNNNYFEIERSANSKDFSTVAVILDGFTTEGTGKRYAFKEDAATLNNTIAYYRLKQFDANGKVSYSQIIKVQK